MLEEKIAQEKSIQKDYTSEELMTAFNSRREIYNARQLNQNKYLCKIAELRLIDVVKRGETAFSDKEAFQKDYDYVHGNAQNSQLTKESHLPDNVFVLFTKQTNVDSAISNWEQDFDTSYLLSDTNYEFGCAMVSNGYGVLVIGSDNEPFEPKLEDNMSTVSI